MGLGIVRINNRRLILRRCIAEGGFSFVFEAEEMRTHQRFAVKKMIIQTPEQARQAR